MSTVPTCSSRKSENYEILTNQLVSILGFDDGATDVLDHLLTIESRSDLLNYLTQLLGKDKMELLIQFVENVYKYRIGEEPTVFAMNNNDITNDKNDKIDNEKESANTAILTKETRKTSSLNTASVPTKNSQQEQDPKNVKKKSIDDKNRNTSKKIKSALSNPKKQQGNQSNSKTFATTAKNTTATTETRVTKSEVVDVVPTPETFTTTIESYSAKASTGVRTKPICGCFGTIHSKVVANCLHCGRICCQKEGNNDYCPFCTYLVLPVPTSANELLGLGTNNGVGSSGVLNDEEKILHAWNEKERLLQYDREFTQRTFIIDDQEDYYPNQTIWLTEDEEIVAWKREQQRSNAVSKRNHLQLSLMFENKL